MNTRHNLGRALPTAAITLAALAAGFGLWLGSRAFAPTTLPTVRSALLYPQSREIPPFTLTRSDGSPLHLANWQGKWNLVFFGFTHCPDVCPSTLGILKQVRANLVERHLGERVGMNFISVDPARDTPEQLTRYAAFFSADLVAATGDDAELTALTRSLGLLYVRTPTANGDYTVDHSASIVIVDPMGRMAGQFRPPLDAASISADLTVLAGNP
ncbi:MAG: SCO family protein [Tahibacter sp.]